MYPYDLLPGVDLYFIFLCLAIVSAIVVYRIMSDKLKIGTKLYNFGLFTAVISIIVGYLSAVLFQGFYNIATYGKFYIRGATFYGGLIGGAGCFLVIYFLVGKAMFKENKEHISRFFDIADIAACSIAIAHSLGRVGCLMVGCCHGKPTAAWFGIKMVTLGYKVVPTQLFEAIFLAVLFVYLILRVKDKQTYCLQIYMCVYGVWRFIIEYMRNDYRGTTIVDALTPSQLTAVLMVLGGAALIYLQYRVTNRDETDSLVTENEASQETVSEFSESVESAEDDDEEEEYDYASVYQKKDDTADKADQTKDE